MKPLAGEPRCRTGTENEAIRQIEARFNAAWNWHDPDGMVELLIDDGQFVTVNGVWMKNAASS